MFAVVVDISQRFEVWQLVGLGLCFVGARAITVASDERLEKVLGQSVLDALNRIHLTTKEAAALMLIDHGNLTSMLRGEGRYHLGLVHLARLPFTFWTVFGPTLFYLMAKQNIQQIQEDLGLGKSA